MELFDESKLGDESANICLLLRRRNEPQLKFVGAGPNPGKFLSGGSYLAATQPRSGKEFYT